MDKKYFLDIEGRLTHIISIMEELENSFYDPKDVRLVSRFIFYLQSGFFIQYYLKNVRNTGDTT